MGENGTKQTGGSDQRLKIESGRKEQGQHAEQSPDGSHSPSELLGRLRRLDEGARLVTLRVAREGPEDVPAVSYHIVMHLARAKREESAK